jgi:pSer/pThr/pTyr-binding forkhead associated (FHA) protein
VIQLTILNGATAGQTFLARRFPVRLGRSRRSDVRLEADGVWDRHLDVRLDAKRGFVASLRANAFAAVNGQPVQETIVRNGDVIEVGSVRILFSLSPPRQRSLRLREALTWLAWVALFCGQAALIYWLVG